MTDIAADDLLLTAQVSVQAPDAAPPQGFARHERDPRAAQATLMVLNLLMIVALLAILWTPAVIFWAALALAPLTLIGILAITLGWWL